MALLLYQHIQQLYRDNKISGDQLIILNNELISFTDICGACERIVFYVLASLELIAEEIEDPFGGDPNDVPSEKLAATIQRSVAEIL